MSATADRLWEALTSNIEAGGRPRHHIEVWRRLIELEARRRAGAAAASQIPLGSTPAPIPFEDRWRDTERRHFREALLAIFDASEGQPEIREIARLALDGLTDRETR